MNGITPSRSDDWLLTPDNAVITFIDYQPDQYAGMQSMPVDELLVNVVTLGQLATAYALPVVLSTVGMKMRGMKGTNTELHAALNNAPEIDRNTLNSWEDPDFRAAVETTGRKKLIVAGLWTEICVAFPVLDALHAGYEVYVVEDAIGGVSKTAHDAAMRRMEQAGARPITVIGLAGELQRDWSRPGADRLRAVLGSYFGGHHALKSRR
ncbi:hydrolase [Acidovorax sp.]|uniref:hydrolase n=1 Tax=Acidovorax sp. TaxID=1872122 RepID=UPI00261C75A2|nr:hydrolase [Acidovorax sp.]